MRILALSAAAMLALPAAAQAQAAGDPPVLDYSADDAPLSQQLRDPAMQDGLAATVAVLGEILLDLPLAPIVEPMAEAAGRDPGDVDPDLTLRKMRPEAGDLPARAAEELPRAMDRMAAMAGGIEAMAPALRDLAGQLEFALDRARRQGR
ncbi:hypothetical protein V5F89_05105 [Pelagerythrobacter marensis]|uniref:Uncharacterized protein n=1 Tax=Pelagerythrobacter marensis TaxID=543877 RepID=A0ABZ2D5F8_9SPHN